MLLYIPAGFVVTALAVLVANMLLYGTQDPNPMLATLDGGLLLILSAPAALVALLLRKCNDLIVGAAFVAIAVATNLIFTKMTAASVALTQHVNFMPVIVDGAFTAIGLVGYTIYFALIAALQFGVLHVTSRHNHKVRSGS